jgi:hypothetical protein
MAEIGHTVGGFPPPHPSLSAFGRIFPLQTNRPIREKEWHPSCLDLEQDFISCITTDTIPVGSPLEPES